MRPFLNLIDTITETLEAHPFVNTVTYGDLFEVALEKQTIYPLAHINVENVSYSTNTLTLSILLSCMGRYSDNETYVLEEQLTVANDLFQRLSRGTLHDDQYQLEGTPSGNPFKLRFEDDAVGWDFSFTVVIPNDFGQE